MKRINWRELLDPHLAYTAKEIALLLDVNIITARNYIYRAVAANILEERRKGRIKLYALADAIEQDSSRQTPAKPEN